MGAHMSQPPVKEGLLERYKSGLLSSRWRSAYAKLYPDSTLALYNERSNSRPAESIFIKNVIPYICVGFMTDRMPVKRPELPAGTEVQRLVGIGMDAQASKVHWILFPSVQNLEEWLGAIMSTLPKPPVSPSSAATTVVEGTPQPTEGYVPPAKYPEAPPPYGQQQPVGAGPTAAGQQPYYPPQPGQQQPQYPVQHTVVIDRTEAHGAGGGGGIGTGLAAGMGGAMLGGLMGYGIGSMFAPHGGWGAHAPAGYGLQDNDTYVTNNYFISNDGSNAAIPAQNAETPGFENQDYSTPAENAYEENGGGGYYDDGGDFGGDGGDW